MDKKILGLIAVLTLATIFILNSNQSTKTHNLITAQKAEAFILFQNWIKQHTKTYRQENQKSYRFQKFFENFLFVQEHNKRYQSNLQTFQVAINQFADLDRHQFKALYTGLKRKSKNQQITKKCTGQILDIGQLPQSVDWAGKAVSSVKNQGSCGSCWAFSAVGALQGLAALKKGTLYNFSPQQLVDCSTKAEYGNQGCNGGEMNAAMWYVIDHGITTQDKYPYHGRDQKCNYTSSMNVFQNNFCAQVPANKTKELMNAVAQQPVSISVEADTLAFQFYSKGVFSGKCGTDLDHGIVLTGYGTLDGKDYWKCKNSWGASWGMSGYILISRTKEDGPGQCGILMENTVPLAYC